MIRLTIAPLLLASLPPGAEADVLCRGNSHTVKIRTEACKNNETAVDIEALLVKPADERFSIMWNTNSFITHSAAIRVNASIRASTDPTMSVVKQGRDSIALRHRPASKTPSASCNKAFPRRVLST